MNHRWGLTLLIFLTGFFAQAADYPVSSFQARVGTFQGTLASLTAIDSKFFQFYTNGKGNLTIDFQFKLSSIQPQLQTVIRTKQKRSTDVFTLFYKDLAGQFKIIGKISGKAGAFQDNIFSMPQSAIQNGLVILRFQSSRGSDDGQIDLVMIQDATTLAQPSEPQQPAPESTPQPLPPASEPPATTPSVGTVAPQTTWYWQLQGTLNTAVNAKIYDLDLYDSSVTTIQNLKSSGKLVVCYFSAGSYEDWRSDANLFPQIALGQNLDGWPGEKWLDVRNPDVRKIMAQRMDLAKSKGCDALEPDNVDGYSNKSGFPLTAQDQINYLRYLADQAHSRGLLIALKNSTDLVTSLVDQFDFAVVEECFKYNECEMYSPFIKKGKAVLNAEYTSYSTAVCTKAANLKFSTVFFNLDLNGKVFQPCP